MGCGRLALIDNGGSETDALPETIHFDALFHGKHRPIACVRTPPAVAPR